jgi:formylglycine-generating enzyme required for sulfatase activity
MPRPLRVFLCHASQDKPAVRKLYDALKIEDWIDPWLDEEKLSFGQHWTTVIEDALDAADVVLIFLSRNSVHKEGFVQRELNYAWELSLEKPRGVIFLIPFRLDDCEVPRFLRSRQWGDYFGDKKESTYQILLRSLKQRYEQRMRLEEEELEREQGEQQAKREVEESARKLAAEQAEREKAEREAKEKADRESVEKSAREKLEIEAIEAAKREKAERDAKEKTEREAAEKATRKKLELEVLEKTNREVAVRKKAEREARQRKQREFISLNSRWFGIGGIILLVLIFGGFGLNYLIKNLPVATVMVSPTNTVTPNLPTSTSTKIPMPTPTLGIGSIMTGDHGEILVYVPVGEFTMGSDSGDSDEKPVHTVYLDAFWIDQFEVTNKQYQACVDAGTCEPPSSSSSYTHPSYYENLEFDNYPVLNVNWDKANRYCEVWAGGDLPTEAQWEKAARGTDERTYPWGNDAPNEGLLNYNTNVGDTTTVGSYPGGKSPYEVYDMAGNVWEWVNDYYQSDYYTLLGGNASNPFGPDSGQYRVLRGGTWFNSDDDVRSASRNWYDPTYAYNFGFRCVRSP